MRAAVGPNFIIIFRLSMLDLVEGGNTWEEIVQLAEAIEQAGATIINTGIGWHEARIPTIATKVPRGAFSKVTAKFRGAVQIPLITTNRINTPEIAEQILAEGDADMVSIGATVPCRPGVRQQSCCRSRRWKSTPARLQLRRAWTCMGGKLTTCLVNPRACYETELDTCRCGRSKKSPWSAPARRVWPPPRWRLSAASRDAVRFGQRRSVASSTSPSACRARKSSLKPCAISTCKLQTTHVELCLNTRVDAAQLAAGGYDEIILATGIAPRTPAIPGVENAKVLSYLDVILERKPVGKRVAVIGAGGIGFDVSEFLVHQGVSTSLDRAAFWKEWGIDTHLQARGGVAGIKAERHAPAREVFLLQRKAFKVGDGLGKTTGWIHRTGLKNKQVQMLNSVEYLKIDDDGLHIRIGAEGEPQLLAVDNIVICAGQDPLRELHDGLVAAGQNVHLIGGLT